ncbi:hypothetical protein AVW11_28425 [Streptomyces amritsarensis]|uniref:Uncharacterized protein n=1 Tax=Streptomyces amritsarensis TaxID=681158 RepID=A0ABX3FVV3_9ACTN|nr:hypothetical protein [Streptomyces amritsarensis]OLZ58235.1 hypothetical protein AVW11_28425 [Streptomyces amritsarensis]
MAGADVHPQFDFRAVAAWLVAHDKIEVPAGPTLATLVLAGVGAGGASHRFRLDDPWLTLADDAGGEDTLSGWSTDTDADAIAALAAGEFGAVLRRLAAPGAGPLAVPGEVRVIDRFRSGSGGLRLTLAWPAGLARHRRPGAGGRSGPSRGRVRRSGRGLRLYAARLRWRGPGLLVCRARRRRGAGVGVAPRRRDPLHRPLGRTGGRGRADAEVTVD